MRRIIGRILRAALCLALLGVVGLGAWSVLASINPFERCYADCSYRDGNKPVPAEEVASLRILHLDKPLPVEARNVYFFEACGIDCMQAARFELPVNRAEAIMTAMTGVAPVGLDDWERRDFKNRAPAGQRWWAEPAAGAKGAPKDLSEGRLWAFALVPHDTVTRVYLFSFTM